MKRLVFVGIYILAILYMPISVMQTVYAHQSGCHRWHSCPSDTGSYVCGDLGYTSGCPTSTPTAPVISTKNITSEESIIFSSQTVYDSHEYPDYSKVSQEGENGKSEVTTLVTYTNGKETSRDTSTKMAKLEPKSKIIVVGSRIKPLATIDSISKTKKKDKYDVSGTYKTNSEVVLSLNGKKIKRTKTDGNGKFTFKNIKITENDDELKIYKRDNRKESQISELTYITLNPNTIKTEYQKLHQS